MTGRRRCAWCGLFVRRAQPLTAWRVRVGRGSRQNPRSPWNYWARLLCPSCATATDGNECWQRSDVVTVVLLRGHRAVSERAA